MSRLSNTAYWIATVLVAFCSISGGAAEAVHFRGNVEGVVLRLGYPMYFLTIIGIWKVLGGALILLPGFPRLKEWAYAGIVFNVTGAAASHIAVGDYGGFAFHVLINLGLAGLTIVSWALRPPSRIIGSIPPAKFSPTADRHATPVAMTA